MKLLSTKDNKKTNELTLGLCKSNDNDEFEKQCKFKVFKNITCTT